VKQWGKKGTTCHIKRDLGNLTIEKLESISRFRPSNSNIPLIHARGGSKDPTGSPKQNSGTLIRQSCEHPRTNGVLLSVFRGYRAFVRREWISDRPGIVRLSLFFPFPSRGKSRKKFDNARSRFPASDVLPADGCSPRKGNAVEGYRSSSEYQWSSGIPGMARRN